MTDLYQLPVPPHLVAPVEFEATALNLFRYQAQHNVVYRSFLYHLNVHPEKVAAIDKIPFLPISFFKTHKVQTGEWEAEKVFKSSGTGNQTRSLHYVPDLGFYARHSKHLFEQQYGPLSNWVVVALLPSYIVQGDSSLVYMVEKFIEASGHPVSGFYLQQPGEVVFALQQAAASGKKVLLIGVSYALLDLIEKEEIPEIPNLVVIETGGMKGRRKEMVRSELHRQLSEGFGVAKIHSEYGMTELLSQAYSAGDGLFLPSAALRILIRETNDPFSATNKPGRGGINVIDLANTASCAFIETQDLGHLHQDGSFEVLGRFDNSDIRGCNLLVG